MIEIYRLSMIVSFIVKLLKKNFLVQNMIWVKSEWRIDTAKMFIFNLTI